jgi:hypothetical protein
MAVLAATISCGGSPPPPDPLQLRDGILSVSNQTDSPWQDVEIWLNRVYRVTTPTIAAGSRFDVPLRVFVAAYGQQFPYGQAQVTDLRLTAKDRGGAPVELVFRFSKTRLEDAFERNE